MLSNNRLDNGTNCSILFFSLSHVGYGHTVFGMLTDLQQFLTYENRETKISQQIMSENNDDREDDDDNF
jgi:hypothetical protein